MLEIKKMKKKIQNVYHVGYCRQFMSEFVDKDFKIYSFDGVNIREYKIEELFPFSFKL